MSERGGELLTRHAPLDRAFHWITALSVLLLLGSAFLPIAGLKFSWVPLHWMAGVVLAFALLFHLIRSAFFRRPRSMLVGARDFADARAGRRAAKYTLAHKLMHAAMGTAVLLAAVTGVIMLAKVDTPFWQRNPYLLSAQSWGVVYVLHGVAALLCLTLTMAHVYFALLPEKRAYLRAMIGGQMTRADAAQFHDPQRWAGNRKQDPHENGT